MKQAVCNTLFFQFLCSFFLFSFTIAFFLRVFSFSELTVNIISLSYLTVLSFFVHFFSTDFLCLTCSLGARGAHDWAVVSVSLFPYFSWGLTSTNRSVQRPLLPNSTVNC